MKKRYYQVESLKGNDKFISTFVREFIQSKCRGGMSLAYKELCNSLRERFNIDKLIGLAVKKNDDSGDFYIRVYDIKSDGNFYPASYDEAEGMCYVEIDDGEEERNDNRG